MKIIYRTDVIWTPLLNRTPSLENSNITPVKNLYLGQKLIKLEPNLNWSPPKNPFWKIEPWGSNNVDTVTIARNLGCFKHLILSSLKPNYSVQESWFTSLFISFRILPNLLSFHWKDLNFYDVSIVLLIFFKQLNWQIDCLISVT